MEEKDKIPEENDAFSSALGSILSNPEMMSMISSMADKLKNGAATSGEPQDVALEKVKEEEETAAEKAVPPLGDLSGAMNAIAPLLSGKALAGSAQNDNRACLLRALKPYLCKSRCDAIDHIITFSRISELLKTADWRKNT